MKKPLFLLLFLFISTLIGAEDYYLVINTDSNPHGRPIYLGHYFPHFGGETTVAHREGNGYELLPYEIPIVERSYGHDDPVGEFYYGGENGEILRMHAQLVYGDPDSSCLIYVQRSGAVRAFDWQEVGIWFDQEVYPQVSAVYGTPTDIDGNGKVILLFYKFYETGLVGYFSDGDLYDRNQYTDSNESEIIYFNLSEEDPMSALMKETLPHELQHLINSSVRLTKGYPEMPIWMNEGLAENSASMQLGIPSRFHISLWSDADGHFWNGAPLCRWDSSLENYAMVYLFMDFVKTQAGSNEIFKDLIELEDAGPEGLVALLAQYGKEYRNFPGLLRAFYLSMLFQGEGEYAFNSFQDDLNLQVQPPSSEFSGVLYPGSAVFLPLKHAPVSHDLPRNLMVVDTRDYR